MDLNIKIKDGKFHFGLLDIKDSFPFFIVRMPDNSSNVPSSIVYSAIGAESFSTAIKPLVVRMSRQEGINNVLRNVFYKHQADFNICQVQQELGNSIS